MRHTFLSVGKDTIALREAHEDVSVLLFLLVVGGDGDAGVLCSSGHINSIIKVEENNIIYPV